MLQSGPTVFGIIKFLLLWPSLPHSFSPTWYRSMKAVVEWESEGSLVVPVFIGTPQANILSLKLFNISIDDLLLKL